MANYEKEYDHTLRFHYQLNGRKKKWVEEIEEYGKILKWEHFSK